MGWLEAIRKTLRRTETRDEVSRGSPVQAEEHDPSADFRVPEVSAMELIAEMENDGAPLLLDIREPFERAQMLIPGSLHIPMNSLPYHLAELDRERNIVVYCAHGNRSYDVSGWLIQQGYKARSLKGGIVDWRLNRGAFERGQAGRS